jgi:hypothetical protein
MFSTSSPTAVGNGASAWSGPCATGGDYSIATGNGSWDNTHTFDLSSRGERLGREPNILVQRAERIGGSLDG